MKLTTKGSYALRAMLDLIANSNGTPVKLQEISQRQGISLHYLEQLFRKLRQNNVVHSVRGPGGGYIPAREVENITVADILTGVGEKIKNADSGKITESSTKEDYSVVAFFKTIDATVIQQINTPITALVAKGE